MERVFWVSRSRKYKEKVLINKYIPPVKTITPTSPNPTNLHLNFLLLFLSPIQSLKSLKAKPSNCFFYAPQPLFAAKLKIKNQ